MQMSDVPYIAHEGEVARLERIIKRLWVLCIIIFVAFVLSNGAWIYYESQWQYVEETQKVSQDVTTTSGDATINGDVNINGKSKENSDRDN